MSSGGKRPGAGRPKGAKNKATVERESQIAEEGITPLDFMLNMLRDENAPLDDRKWAAEKAAPFVHPKLSSATVSGDMTVRHEDALDELE